MKTARATVYVHRTRDGQHLTARSARDLTAWLRFLEVEEKAPRTLDAYERTIAALLRMYPDTALNEFDDAQLLEFLTSFPAKSRRIRKAHVASFFGWARTTRRIAAISTKKGRMTVHRHSSTGGVASGRLRVPSPAPGGPICVSSSPRSSSWSRSPLSRPVVPV